MKKKQRSTPKVRLSEIVDGDDVEHLAIDDFAKHDEDGEKKHYGMMQAGGEEKIIKELKKAGTLDSDGFPIGDASPSLKLKEDILKGNFEEKKGLDEEKKV